MNQGKKYKLLITGGAGFICSNIVKALLNHPDVALVRVYLNDLSNGKNSNLAPCFQNSRFEFVEENIRSFSMCQDACQGIDLISHQVDLGSVPRSVKSPLDRHLVNVFTAAKESGIKNVIYASSYSVYGMGIFLIV